MSRSPGHAGPDLEPHDVAEAPPAQLRLDGAQQVVVALLDLEVGVARDAERSRAPRSPCRGRALPRWAAMTSSSARSGVAAPSGRKRGSTSGTFTRAKRRSPVSGSRTNTPSESERLEMYGNGCPGPDRQRRQHREDLRVERRRGARAPRSCTRRARRCGCPSRASAGQAARPAGCAERRRASAHALARWRASVCSAARPSEGGGAGSAFSTSPPTRTMKNSSRLLAKIARTSAARAAAARRGRARARARRTRAR